jgi:hypothetical protein
MARKTSGRAFGQDIGHGEAGLAPAKGPMKRGKAKALNTTAVKGQGGFADQAVAPKVDPASVRQGVFDGGAPDTVRDARFYEKKRAVERVLGRDLTVDEFRAEHYVADDAPTAMGTSIFDPVLCELAYRWFSPPGGAVLDPFAGGSVRGVVAGILGRRYVGIDLRSEQVHANRVQAELIFDGRDDCPKPQWIEGDSVSQLAGNGNGVAPAESFDFVFSCPPYADLEVYSDDPRDLSTMAYPEFRRAYAEIIRLACARLAPDRFACFVVGDVRDADGCYLSFPQHTIEAFEAAGLRLYNDAILVTAAGSLPIRAGRQFAAGRKLGTTHQRVLVFVKGDGKRAADAVGPVEFDESMFVQADEIFAASDEGAEINTPEVVFCVRVDDVVSPAECCGADPCDR